MSLVFTLVAAHFLEYNPLSRQRGPVYATEPTLEGERARHYAVVGYGDERWLPWVVEAEFGESQWDVHLRAMCLAESPCATRGEAQEVCAKWAGTKWADKLDVGFGNRSVPELLTGIMADMMEIAYHVQAADDETIEGWILGLDPSLQAAAIAGVDEVLHAYDIPVTGAQQQIGQKLFAIREYLRTRQVTN